VLEGTVRKAGDRLRITAQLTSTEDGRLLWSQRYDRQLMDVFAIQDEIAATIVNTLRATMFADVSEHVARRYTENIQAYGLYLKGRYEWNKRTREGVAAAIHYFERAIAEDPDYAPAYAGLSDSYSLDVDYRSIPVHDAYQRAKEYARKALALDESVPTAHASLAWALFIYDWQWDEAEREFRRAIELNPRYASAHQWFSFLLAARGQHDAALLEGHTALELDPASVSVRRAVGWLYYYARRFDQAREHLSRAIEMNPMAVESYRMLGTTLALRGDLAEAERVLREALTLEGAAAYSKAALGWLLARSGRRDEAEQLLHDLEVARERGYVSPVAFAILHIGLGNLQNALDWAERAYDERRGWLAYVNVNPIFDPLRAEPRFGALVRKMRL
jgi:serine/threonine-protein kinase